ncbi:MAG: chromate transporter [Burkholderiaceae bacterium]
MSLSLTTADWLALFGHFASLSLLAVGGAVTAAPEMHRYLVGERMWLSDAQFTSGFALAQAAPGPNVLFVALMGWNVGLNAGGFATAILGMSVAMLGILLPSTCLTYGAARWGHRHQGLRSVRAFKQAMAPIVVALLVATGWILSAAHSDFERDWRVWLLTLVATLLVWRTKIHLLWLLGTGALLGALGWV